MKKNTLKVAFIAAFAIVAGYNVYNSHKTDAMYDLVLDNIEALATPETNDEFTSRTDCIATLDNYSCHGRDGRTYSFAYHK